MGKFAQLYACQALFVNFIMEIWNCDMVLTKNPPIYFYWSDTHKYIERGKTDILYTQIYRKR
jgi:hypothetical protein